MGGHATCAVQRAADDSLELLHGALAVVVDERVVELGRELQLPLGDVEPLVDLTLALGRPRAQPALALLAAGGGDEDRDRGRDPVANGERATRLDLEHRRTSLARNPLELGPERSRPIPLAPWQLDPLEEAPLFEPLVELRVGQEPVIPAVLLGGSLRPGR